MSAPTAPDRAALAERLRFFARGLRRIADTLCNSADCDIPHLDCTVSADAMDAAAAALAAPALPPSVAEARDRWSNAMCDLVLAMTAGATDDRDAIPGDYEAALQGLEAARDDLLAAVRAATVAEAVRVVEELPDHLTAADDPRETFLWRADALDALRALRGQP